MAKVARFVPSVVSDPLTALDEEVCVVELSADDERILIGGGFSIRVIDAVSGKDVRAFRPDGEAAWSARFTPDGARVIGGIGDHLVVWNAKTGAVVHDLQTNGIVRRISISRDGKKAISSTWDKDVRLWDLTKGKELGGFTMEKSFVNGAALSPDAKLVACGGSDGIVRLCDPISGDVKKAVMGKGWIDVIGAPPSRRRQARRRVRKESGAARVERREREGRRRARRSRQGHGAELLARRSQHRHGRTAARPRVDGSLSGIRARGRRRRLCLCDAAGAGR